MYESLTEIEIVARHRIAERVRRARRERPARRWWRPTHRAIDSPVRGEDRMTYVILIQSNPRPWGHPTADFVSEHQALPSATRARRDEEFEAGFAEVVRRGELVHAQALAAPATSRLFRWDDVEHVVTDGPYARSQEHLAGFFVIDVESQERAEEIASLFSGPGETVELRPTMGAVS